MMLIQLFLLPCRTALFLLFPVLPDYYYKVVKVEHGCISYLLSSDDIVHLYLYVVCLKADSLIAPF